MPPKVRNFNKVVIWGLKKRFHTHRYIFQGYYDTLVKTGVPVILVEDEARNRGCVEKNDLIISADVSGKMIPVRNNISEYALPVRDDVYYCLHNFDPKFTGQIRPDRLLNLQVYVRHAEEFEKISEAVYYDDKTRTLFQPWGTNLLPSEFKKPLFSKSKFVFWIGSIWNNAAGQGNFGEIEILKRALAKRDLHFLNLRFMPERANTTLIRCSRLAPAVAGKYQASIDYLPCRMFKNISYGQLGFSNVKKFDEIFVGCNIYDQNIENMVGKVLSLSRGEYLEIVRQQQEICKKYTYVQHLNNIFSHL